MIAVFILTVFLTGIFQLVVGCLTGRQVFVLTNGNFLRNGIVVGTIVGDVQLTVAIDQRQVAVTIETASVSCTQGDEVAMIHIVDGCRGITKHGWGVGMGCGQRRTRRRITTGKHGIVDDDAGIVQAAPSGCICVLIFQVIQVFSEHIITHFISMTIHRRGCLHPGARLYQHLAVLGENLLTVFCLIRTIFILIIVSIITIIVTNTYLLGKAQGLHPIIIVLVGTIHIPHIAAAEHVAIAESHTCSCADLTAKDIHLGLSEHETVGME